MMNNNDKAVTIINTAIEQWRNAKGIGTAFVPAIINPDAILLLLLQKMCNKTYIPGILILVNNFNERTNIIEFLTNQESESNNKEFKALIEKRVIKILTINYIENNIYNFDANLIILYRPEEISKKLVSILNKPRYNFVILTKYIKDDAIRNSLYSIAPLLTIFNNEEIARVRTSTPVEEMYVLLDITDENILKQLNYYTEYITTSINIFGSFDILKQARMGNPKLNLSANAICDNIARENGWNERLDMTIEYNQEIDKLYNPINLRDRAGYTYEYIRNRIELLANYEPKLEKVAEIVINNLDKKILIINKKAEFATKVADYINKTYGKDIVKAVHEKLEPITDIDENGQYICYKSGINKGKPRTLGVVSQRNKYVTMFNSNQITALSVSNSPDKDLSIAIDIVIITSPFCSSIEDYIYRLSNIYFNNNKIKLITISTVGTTEFKSLLSKPVTSTHIILNKPENNIGLVENTDDIIVD